MATINFLKTPTPKTHHDLKIWHACSIIVTLVVATTVAIVQINQMRLLHAVRQERNALASHKHEWDAIITKHETLTKEYKQLQDYMALIKSIDTKQQQIITQLTSFKKTIHESQSSLLSLALSNNKSITMTIQCPCQNRACTLSQALSQTPLIASLKLNALTPNTHKNKPGFLMTMKGQIL